MVPIDTQGLDNTGPDRHLQPIRLGFRIGALGSIEDGFIIDWARLATGLAQRSIRREQQHTDDPGTDARRLLW